MFHFCHESPAEPPTSVPSKPNATLLPLAVAGAVMFMTAWAVPVHAAPIGAAEAPAESTQTSRRYDIPAGSLEKVLSRFLAESGTLLAGVSAMTQGKSISGLQGSYSVGGALRALLAGTGLEAVRQADGSYSLRSAQTAAAPAADGALPQVTVMGATERETAWGPVRGYVATRSATGTKTDTPIIETPQSISVVTKDAIETQGTANIADALRYTAGVGPAAYANGAGDSYDSLVVRGFLLSNSGLLQDGMRLKYNIFDPPTEAYGLERIEVLRGPSSTLYGQSGPSGVVNFVTKRPQAEPLHVVEMQTGSHDRGQLATDHAGALNADGMLQYRLTALVRESGTWVDFDRDNRVFFAPAITWRPNAATSLTVLASYLKTKTGYYVGLPFSGTVSPSVYGRVARERNLGEPQLNYWNTEGSTIGYLFDHRFDDTWKLSQSLRYARSNLDYAHLYPILSSDSRTVARQAFRRHDDSNTLVFDNNLQATWSTANATHTTLIGLDYARSNYAWYRDRGAARSIDLYAPIYGLGDPTAALTRRNDETTKARQLGLYAQQQSKFAQRWVLTAGLRKDWSHIETFNQLTEARSRRDDSKLTGRFGLTYLDGSGLAPYISYSTSFEPSAYSYYDGTAFKPTTGQQYEAGIKYQPAGGRMLLTAAVFDLKQQNVSTQDPDQVNRPGGLVQTGEIASKGLELEASAEPMRGLQLRGSLTLTDAKVTRSNLAEEIGRRPADVPARMLSLWADYTFREPLLRGWTVGGGVRYVSGTYDDTNKVNTGDRTLVDAMLGYRTGNWQFALNVTNLFDKSYLNSCRTSLCWYGRPREWRLTAKYGW